VTGESTEQPHRSVSLNPDHHNLLQLFASDKPVKSDMTPKAQQTAAASNNVELLH